MSLDMYLDVHLEGAEIKVESLSPSTKCLRIVTRSGQTIHLSSTTMDPLNTISQAIFDFALSEELNDPNKTWGFGSGQIPA